MTACQPMPCSPSLLDTKLKVRQPVLDVTLVMLGLPIVLSREFGNPFVAAGSCLLMVTLFLIIVLAFQGMGINYLIRPSLASWGPLMIFVPLAMWKSEPLRR